MWLKTSYPPASHALRASLPHLACVALMGKLSERVRVVSWEERALIRRLRESSGERLLRLMWSELATEVAAEAAALAVHLGSVLRHHLSRPLSLACFATVSRTMEVLQQKSQRWPWKEQNIPSPLAQQGCAL